MYCFALLCVVCLDSLALIAYNQVSVVLLELLKQSISPGRFVVDHGDLECFERERLQVFNHSDSLLFRSQERLAGHLEVCDLCDLFWPDRHDGRWCDYQDSLDRAFFICGSCDGDRSSGLAASISNKRPKPLFVLAAIIIPPSLICCWLQFLELYAIHQLSVFQDAFSAYASDSLVFIVPVLAAIVALVVLRVLQSFEFTACGQCCAVQFFCDQSEVVSCIYHAAQSFHFFLCPFSGGTELAESRFQGPGSGA